MIPKPGYEADQGWVEFDPRARVVALVCFMVAVCGASRLTVLAGLAFLALLMTIPAGLRPGTTARRLVPVNIFMIMIWATMPFLTTGPRLTLAGPLAVSVQGMYQALSITLKANALVLGTSAILYPVELGSLAVGLRRLGVPVKIAWLFVLSYRYVFGLADKVTKSMLAIRMRSNRGGKLRFQAYGGLLAKLFVVGYQSGERLHIAMLARGYGDLFLLHRHLGWRARDTFLVACLACLAALAIGLGRA